MKKVLTFGMAVMMISLLSYSAWFAFNKYNANKNKETTVQYVVDEKGNPTVTYIENNVSPRKLLKFIDTIEAFEFTNLSGVMQVFTVKVKLN